jgi:hypothetical protein
MRHMKLAIPSIAAIGLISSIATMGAATLMTTPAAAQSYFFSTGDPDGKIATLSRTNDGGLLQTETADDFVLTQSTRIDSATFTGLLPIGVALNDATRVEIEIYHVFPVDSTNPPSGNVPARANSPADVEIDPATRDSLDSSLSFVGGVISPNFTTLNSVVNGINKSPNQLTMGEGPATGQEVQFNVTFNPGIVLAADHYFFRPEVALNTGNFLWLSAPRPIVAPGTPFPAGTTDLQSWTRNDNLAPDWLRIGSDITAQGPFNAAFALTGVLVPEPSSVLPVCGALAAASLRRRRLVRTMHIQ